VLQVELVPVEDRGLGVTLTEHGRYSGVGWDDAVVGEPPHSPIPVTGDPFSAGSLVS
jgi:hypothetical protein